eukprot:s519_g12.t1
MPPLRKAGLFNGAQVNAVLTEKGLKDAVGENVASDEIVSEIVAYAAQTEDDDDDESNDEQEDLLTLTVENLKALLTEKARSDFKPSLKTEYVNEGVEKKDREGRHPDDKKSGGGDDKDGGDDGDSSDGGDDFSDFSNDDTNITVYVDTRAMLYNITTPSFKVKTSWPVRYLKLALYGKYGIPPNVPRLTAVGGGTIFPQRSFRDNNIRDGQTLVLLSFGDGGVKRTIVKEKDESKVIRLKQRVRSDVREVEVQELDELILPLEALRDLMNTGFSIQTLLGDADGHTLKQVSDLIAVGLSGKSSRSRLTSIHKLLRDLKTLHENGLTVCKDAYQHVYHNFMTDYAEQFHTINVSDATLNHTAFKDVD